MTGKTCPLNQSKGCYGKDCAVWNYMSEECGIQTLITLAECALDQIKG